MFVVCYILSRTREILSVATTLPVIQKVGSCSPRCRVRVHISMIWCEILNTDFKSTFHGRLKRNTALSGNFDRRLIYWKCGFSRQVNIKICLSALKHCHTIHYTDNVVQLYELCTGIYLLYKDSKRIKHLTVTLLILNMGLLGTVYLEIERAR